MCRHACRNFLLLALAGWLVGVASSQPPPRAPERGTRPGRENPQPGETTRPEKAITNSLGMKLVLIPAGKFVMGSPRSEPGHGEDEEQHEVEITRPFYLGAYEVTLGQFRAFVRGTGYQTEAEKDGKGGWGFTAEDEEFQQKPTYNWKNTGWERTEEHPVVNATWNDAVAFCAWLSRQESRRYRLPTEAEWEYCCRAGRASKRRTRPRSPRTCPSRSP